MTEETKTETPAAPARKKTVRKTQLSARQKAEAVRMHGEGVTTVEISKKFGVNRKTFDRLFEAEGVLKGATARQTEEKVAAETQAVLITQASINAERAIKTREQTYLVTDHLRKLVVATIKEARDKGLALGSVQNDLRAIKEAASAIKIIREEQFAVLGIDVNERDKTTDLPELTIQTLTSEQIEQLKGQSFSSALSNDMPDVELDEHEGENDDRRD